MSVELLGAGKVERSLSGIAHRMTDATEVMRREAKALEAAEAGVFAELAGRYVRTGVTMRSLTASNAPHAVRRAGPQSLEFGTSVRYARYLTEHIGPPTDAGGMKRPLPVAVLKLTEATRRQVAHDYMNHITGQPGSLGLASTVFGGML